MFSSSLVVCFSSVAVIFISNKPLNFLSGYCPVSASGSSSFTPSLNPDSYMAQAGIIKLFCFLVCVCELKSNGYRFDSHISLANGTC